MPGHVASLFSRRTRRSTFADYVRRKLTAGANEGPTHKLLAERLRTFTDDMKVELYAGDVRNAIDAAFVHGREVGERMRPAAALQPPLTIRRSVALFILAAARRAFG